MSNFRREISPPNKASKKQVNQLAREEAIKSLASSIRVPGSNFFLLSRNGTEWSKTLRELTHSLASDNPQSALAHLPSAKAHKRYVVELVQSYEIASPCNSIWGSLSIF